MLKNNDRNSYLRSFQQAVLLKLLKNATDNQGFEQFPQGFQQAFEVFRLKIEFCRTANV